VIRCELEAAQLSSKVSKPGYVAAMPSGLAQLARNVQPAQARERERERESKAAGDRLCEGRALRRPAKSKWLLGLCSKIAAGQVFADNTIVARYKSWWSGRPTRLALIYS